MHKPRLLLTALLACGLLAANAGNSAPGVNAPVLQGSASKAPATRVEGREALETGVAAALVGAVAQQFGERQVEVRIDSVDVAPLSAMDRQVQGQGRLLLGGEGDWLPFRYQANYDTQAGVAMAPRLIIGAPAPGKALAGSGELARELRGQVEHALADEFDQQRFKLQFDSVTATDANARYQRIDAQGSVDFFDEGATPTSVSALYDRRTGELLHVTYELGTAWALDQDGIEQAGRIAAR